MGIQLNGITGDITTPGDVGIGGTLTYEDVAKCRLNWYCHI